jgi:hypothetical protein
MIVFERRGGSGVVRVGGGGKWRWSGGGRGTRCTVIGYFIY